MRACRASAYLLGVLLTAGLSVFALPLLCLPALRSPWVRGHQCGAAWMRGVAVQTHPVRLRRYVRWLAAHAAVGVPAGLFALLCVGNLLLAAVVTPLWWVFPTADPPRLFIEVPVTGWGTALTLGPLQIAALAGLAYWVLPRLADVHAQITLGLLAPSTAERLAQRISVLTRTRADVLEAHGAELRRIERDLHDGTQARLVAIAMRLAVARQALPGNPEMVAKLLQQAHEGAEEAMTELRDVIQTIYPPILADHGLAGAIRTVAARAAVPTDVDIGDLGQVPAAVETVAYFAVTEALTNTSKHSLASRAQVRAHRTGDRLSITVTDDGIGGASDQRGTGLVGIRRRAEALDGTVRVTSPPGGPTTVTVDLPCGW